jgi:hypothetical protein
MFRFDNNNSSNNLFLWVILALLIINLILSLFHLKGNSKCCSECSNENWLNPNEYNQDPDYGNKTYAGCACRSYGVKMSRNMKFNDDSDLYKDSIYQRY